MERSLFDIQPASCRTPLPVKEIETADIWKRILFFDPAEVYKRVEFQLDPFLRNNTSRNISANDVFPPIPGNYCDCGCGSRLGKGKRRWASEDCRKISWYVSQAIRGDVGINRFLLCLYYFGNGRLEGCVECGLIGDLPDRPNWESRMDYRSSLEVDHIVPVHKGGGGCWLGNLRPVCWQCHQRKTNRDRRGKPLIITV